MLREIRKFVSTIIAICAPIFFLLAGGYLSMFGYIDALAQIMRNKYIPYINTMPFVSSWTPTYAGPSIPVWKINWFVCLGCPDIASFTISTEAALTICVLFIWVFKIAWDIRKAWKQNH